MSETRYKVIFSGEPLPSVSDEILKANLVQLFKISLEDAHLLLHRGDRTIKRDLPEAEADRYVAALQNAGGIARKEAEFALLLDDAPQEKTQAAEAEPAAEQKQIISPQPGAASAQPNPYSPPKAATLSAGDEVDDEDLGYPEALNPYSAEGRIGRLRYLAWNMAALLAIGPPLYLVTSLLTWISTSLSFLSMLLIFAAGIALIVCSFRFAIQRLHDLGFSGWFVLLHFVPIAGAILPFVLMIMPGSPKRNIYGPPPPPNSLAVQLLASLWLLWIAFGLLSVVFRIIRHAFS